MCMHVCACVCTYLCVCVCVCVLVVTLVCKLENSGFAPPTWRYWRKLICTGANLYRCVLDECSSLALRLWHVYCVQVHIISKFSFFRVGT